jgi:hypothetical protein
MGPAAFVVQVKLLEGEGLSRKAGDSPAWVGGVDSAVQAEEAAQCRLL